MNDEVVISPDLSEIDTSIFTQGTAIIGIRGSGKTNTGVDIAEEAIRHVVPVVVVDPTGVWWGLKSSADGKSPGLPVYVFGGAHADVPLDPNAGALIARLVVERRIPIILDLSDMTKGQQRRFAAEFGETLYDLKARNREALLVIVDEAQRFIPQVLTKGDPALARCLGAFEDIVALGRSRGLGALLIGPRPATINKNVLTACDTLIAMRTVGAQDRKAIDEWVTEAQGAQQQRNELVQNIPMLGTGEGYFWSPATFGVFRRVRFNPRTTFDSSRTPKIGETIAAPTAFAKVDLAALTAEITATIEQAKADDPKALRARIAELEAKVMQGGTTASLPVEVIVEKSILTEADRDLLRKVIGALSTWGAAIDLARSNFDDAKSALDGVDDLIQRIDDGIAPGEPAQGAAQDSRPTKVRQEGRAGVASARAEAGVAHTLPRSQPSSELAPGPQRMLEAVVLLGGSSTRSQIAGLSGYAVSGGAFRTYLSKLKTFGLVGVNHETVTITPQGKALVGVVQPKTSRDVIALWRPQLAPGPLKMLDALIECYPRSVTRDALGDLSGYESSGGAFRTYLSKLKVLQIITVAGQDVRASDTLFPTGKPR